MEQKIRAYARFLADEIRALSEEIEESPGGADERLREKTLALRALHTQRLSDIKAERQVHLLVTLFFGGLLLALFGAVIFFSPALFSSGEQITAIALCALTLIVLIVEGFYIKHYYFLENKLQALYEDERVLYEMVKKTCE